MKDNCLNIRKYQKLVRTDKLYCLNVRKCQNNMVGITIEDIQTIYLFEYQKMLEQHGRVIVKEYYKCDTFRFFQHDILIMSLQVNYCVLRVIQSVKIMIYNFYMKLLTIRSFIQGLLFYNVFFSSSFFHFIEERRIKYSHCQTS